MYRNFKKIDSIELGQNSINYSPQTDRRTKLNKSIINKMKQINYFRFNFYFYMFCSSQNTEHASYANVVLDFVLFFNNKSCNKQIR